MRRCLAVLCGLFLLLNAVTAQPGGQLLIKGYGKDIHLDHKVAPREGIYAIGRFYNVHPKAIAAYNKLDLAKGLSVGQVIHIPLSDTNFSQKENKGTPIYYSVGDKETLQKVSTVNNKVSMENLRGWNKLTDDKLTAGKKLIVGFLVTGQNGAVALPPDEKKEITAKETGKEPGTKQEQDKTVVKTESKKEESQKKQPKREEPSKSESVKKPMGTGEINGQGYFKSNFDAQIKTTPISKTETVTSGIFKMVNDLEEAKYYLLIDDIPSGTIIRVINPDNNKAIYAKVLGEMTGARQNQGLNIRISNAAASTLGIIETEKFIVKINY